MNINGIQLLTVSRCALNKYRNVTRKGKHYSDLDIAKRLTRSCMLGTIINQKGDIATYNYGCMDIIVNTVDGVVITCRNYKGDLLIKSKVNSKEKRELGRLLEIKIDNIWDLANSTYGVGV